MGSARGLGFWAEDAGSWGRRRGVGLSGSGLVSGGALSFGLLRFWCSRARIAVWCPREDPFDRLRFGV